MHRGLAEEVTRNTWPVSGRRAHAIPRQLPMTALRRPPLLLWMVTAITVVASLAYWDGARESELALHDFAEEQASLALAGSAAVEAKLRDVRKEAQAVARELVAAHLPSNARASAGRQGTIRFRTDALPPAALAGD